MPKVSKPDKRAASIRATEYCLTLMISNAFFCDVILAKIKKEMQEKVRLLSCLPYFANDPTIGLIPIANMMQKRIFRLGEAVIKRGETPNSMFLIAEGVCHLVHVAGVSRCLKPGLNVKGLKQPLSNFNFSRDPTMNRNRNQVIESEKETVYNLQNLNVDDILEQHQQAQDGIAQRKLYSDMNTTRNYEFTDLEELNLKNPDFAHYTCHFNLLPNNPLTPPMPLCSRALLSSNIGSDGVSN